MNIHNFNITEQEKQYYSFTKKIWNIFAPLYDIVVVSLSRVRDQVVDFTNAKAGSKILDIATGTGRQAFAFAKRGYDIIGIDLSEAMIKVAHKRNIYSKLKFQTADATNLPFENSSFDVTCISFALHDMPLSIIKRVLKEMIRVTKQNGKMIIVDYNLPAKKIRKYVLYTLIRLYERRYYTDFVKINLPSLLRQFGITIEEKHILMFGSIQLLKGTFSIKNQIDSNDSF